MGILTTSKSSQADDKEEIIGQFKIYFICNIYIKKHKIRELLKNVF